MRIGNSGGNSQPVEMEQTIQETSESSGVQAAEQSQPKESSPELENMKDPRWNQKDAGQIAEHELSGSLMAAQLNSQLSAAKTSETEAEPIAPGHVPIDPNAGFEEKLAKNLYNAGVTVRDYASAIWDIAKKETE